MQATSWPALYILNDITEIYLKNEGDIRNEDDISMIYDIDFIIKASRNLHPRFLYQLHVTK